MKTIYTEKRYVDAQWRISFKIYHPSTVSQRDTTIGSKTNPQIFCLGRTAITKRSRGSERRTFQDNNLICFKECYMFDVCKYLLPTRRPLYECFLFYLATVSCVSPRRSRIVTTTINNIYKIGGLYDTHS